MSSEHALGCRPPAPVACSPAQNKGSERVTRKVRSLRRISAFGNIIDVAKEQRATRRRLHNTIRKTILSYYSEQEAAMVVKAARKQRMTISNFVASAALREAEVVTRKPSKQQ